MSDVKKFIYFVLTIWATIFIAWVGNSLGLDKNSWAGWVQAIGSIVAILAAVFISKYQHQKSEQAADDTAALQKLALLRAIQEVVMMGEKYVDIAIAAFSKDARSVEQYIAGRFSKDVFLDIAHVLDQVPIYSTPGTGLISGLVMMKRVMHESVKTIEMYSAQPFWSDQYRAAAVDRLVTHKNTIKVVTETLTGEILQQNIRVRSRERVTY